MMYKITFYVPESHLDLAKVAMFSAGAGHVGSYDCCAWQVLGEGQFRPGEGTHPFIGVQGTIERVQEWRVEMVCRPECIESAIAALRQVHPYEEPAYDVVKIENF